MGRKKQSRQQDQPAATRKPSASPRADSANRRFWLPLVAVALVGLAFGGWVAWRMAFPNPPPQSPRSANPDNDGPSPAAVSPRAPRFEQFVGSEACARCHQKEFDLWKSSTHGQAGGTPGEVSIIARFDGQPLRFNDAVVTPTTTGSGDRLFIIEQPGRPRIEIPVHAVVGGGHMHGGGTQSFFERFPDGTYRFLPFDFIRRENQWFVQLRENMTWAPITEKISLNSDLANWPPRRVLGTATEFSNCQNCHGSQITLAYDQKSHAYETRFQTLRINCESCHGPGQQHIDLISQPGWEKNADIGMAALAGQSKHESLATCHQCHATKDAIRDEPYLPGAQLEDYFSLKLGMLNDSPFLADGRVRTFSYQSNHEFSDCYLNGSMTCVDCHDPHSQGYRDVFGQPLAGRFDNRQCTSCHASKGVGAEAHSHHKADSAGNLCVSCHMPYLQHRGVGSHFVFSRSDHTIPIPRPSFDQSLGIENACQKCHRDKDLAWQESHMKSWYGQIKPHPQLISNLTQADQRTNLHDAAVSLLDPEARHPMAQMAGLSKFIERFLQPDMSVADPEVVRRLTAFAVNPDPDLRAVALMALHVGYMKHPATAAWIETQLRDLPESDSVRRRWAIAADHLGSALGAKGDVAGAKICFERSLQVQPRNEVTLSHLALACLRSGDALPAIGWLQKAIEAKPTKAVLYFQLAQIYVQLQQAPEAIAALEAGLKYAPNDATARRLLQQLREQ